MGILARTIRRHLWLHCLLSLTVVAGSQRLESAELFVRFQVGQTIAYGLVEGTQVRQLSGNLFGNWKKTDKTFELQEIKILTPTRPTQVLAMAGNYKSHLKGAEIPEKFRIPQPFFKSPSCLIATGEKVILPKDSPGPIHYEAELVVVIGKRARKVAQDKAMDYVFGVTCGNDISERHWQNDENHKDIQWWRAKGSDTFGPVGPYIARGLDYDSLMLRLRLNGELKQEERTTQLIHGISATVSFISQHITLHPGDLIFMGTPGTTGAIKPGDVMEVELEGVGVLRNEVAAESNSDE